MDKAQILENFLNQFDGARGNNDGKVTVDEFIDYYTDLSMSIASDEYFVRMMESTWCCPENENDKEAERSVTHMLREAKSRIFELTRGGDPVFLRKIFDDFDLNSSGSLTIDEVTSMIAKLQISVERKYVHPFFKVIDADNSGDIKYSEFEAYVCGN